MENQFTPSSQDLSINDFIKQQLKVASNWSMFLAILGFIATGLLLLVGIFLAIIDPFKTLSEMGSSSTMVFGKITHYLDIFYIVMAVVAFFPVYHLYQFSKKTTEAIKKNDQPTMEKSFCHLKLFFKIYGIITICIIGIYIVAIIAGIIFASTLMSHHNMMD